MTHSRREVLAMGGAGVLVSSAPALAAGKGLTEAQLRRVPEIAEAAVQAGSAAGLGIRIIRHGQSIFGGGFGYADLESRSPADENSVFRIASVTKTFTAAAVMMLVEQRKLQLDRTLSLFYPDIPGAQSIKISQLLSHTSGLHDYVHGGLPAEFGKWSTADEFATGVVQMNPVQDFPAGAKHAYSNSGYILLGGVIEKVAGQSYADFLRSNIFVPLGMADTALDDPQEVVLRRAHGYTLKDGKPGAFRHMDYMDRLPFSAGALRSSVSDLARWTSGFFAGQVVSPATVRRMITPARVASGALTGEARWWPSGAKPGAPPSFVTKDNYGLGWQLTTFYGRPTANHSGGINGFNSMVVRYLDEDLTLILLANTDNGIVDPFTRLLELFGSKGPT